MTTPRTYKLPRVLCPDGKIRAARQLHPADRYDGSFTCCVSVHKDGREHWIQGRAIKGHHGHFTFRPNYFKPNAHLIFPEQTS